ncbi:MAG TPA: hydrogenase maturation protease [Bryobacteraceae bacterium]
MLILGCGNDDRSDDAAGLLVVRRLRDLGVDAREHGGDILGLLDAWNGAREVVVIDAIVSGAAPGTIIRRDAATPLAAGEFRCSTHNVGLAEAIELARALDRLPEKLTIYGIEATCFDRGGTPLAEVQEAAKRLAAEIQRIFRGADDQEGNGAKQPHDAKILVRLEEVHEGVGDAKGESLGKLHLDGLDRPRVEDSDHADDEDQRHPHLCDHEFHNAPT